jgi:hypothetical protein
MSHTHWSDKKYEQNCDKGNLDTSYRLRWGSIQIGSENEIG